MVKDYYTRQLSNLWNKPLLGCVPYMEQISLPTISGFAELLHGKFIAGEENRFVRTPSSLCCLPLRLLYCLLQPRFAHHLKAVGCC